MQNDQQVTSKKRMILIGIAVAAIVVLLSIGTVLLLKNIGAKNTVSNQPSANVVGPAEAVKAYAVPGTIAGLTEELYQLQQNDVTDMFITHTLDGRKYSVNTATKAHVLFSAKKKIEQSDTEEIQNQTTNFMRPKGYEKVETPKSTTGPITATYVSKTAVCQLTSSDVPAPENTLSYHGLACVEKSAIETEYALTEKLLALYKATPPLPTFKGATRSGFTEGNKSMAVVRLTGADTHPALLFVSVDNVWSYIGDLGAGNKSNGKYAITPEVKVAMNNPVYGSFLSKHIGSDL